MKTREELVKAVEAAAASWAAVDAANAAYDAYVAGKAYVAWYALNDAQDALKSYDKESNDSFHNFAECLCESYQREELVKAVSGADEADLKAYNQARLMEYNAISYTELMEGEYGYRTLYTSVSLGSLIDAHYPFWANTSKGIVIEAPIINWYYEVRGNRKIYWTPEK